MKKSELKKELKCNKLWIETYIELIKISDKEIKVLKANLIIAERKVENQKIEIANGLARADKYRNRVNALVSGATEKNIEIRRLKDRVNELFEREAVKAGQVREITNLVTNIASRNK